MAAALLTDEPCVIRRVPNLSDVKFMAQILEWLGATVKVKGDTVHIHAKKIKGYADYELVRKMRGSINFESVPGETRFQVRIPIRQSM